MKQEQKIIRKAQDKMLEDSKKSKFIEIKEIRDISDILTSSKTSATLATENPFTFSPPEHVHVFGREKKVWRE